MFRFAAKRLGREFSSYCGRAWARFSCCLQRCVSQEILNRIDGLEFRDDAPPLVTVSPASDRPPVPSAAASALPPLLPVSPPAHLTIPRSVPALSPQFSVPEVPLRFPVSFGPPFVPPSVPRFAPVPFVSPREPPVAFGPSPCPLPPASPFFPHSTPPFLIVTRPSLLLEKRF